jgi:hypothetical protein
MASPYEKGFLDLRRNQKKSGSCVFVNQKTLIIENDWSLSVKGIEISHCGPFPEVLRISNTPSFWERQKQDGPASVMGGPSSFVLLFLN